MHTDHAGIASASAVKAALPHQGITHRRIDQIGKLRHFLTGIRGYGAAAQINKGTLCLHNLLCSFLQFLLRAAINRFWDLWGSSGIFTDCCGYIFCNIHQDRPGSAAFRNGKSAPQSFGQFFHIFHNIAMLGNGHGHACDIHFLKAVLPQHGQRHIGSDSHHRDGIHKGCGNACHQIRSTGAAGGHAYAYFAGGPCIPVRRMGSSLFVGSQDMPDLVAVVI